MIFLSCFFLHQPFLLYWILVFFMHRQAFVRGNAFLLVRTSGLLQNNGWKKKVRIISSPYYQQRGICRWLLRVFPIKELDWITVMHSGLSCTLTKVYSKEWRRGEREREIERREREERERKCTYIYIYMNGALLVAQIRTLGYACFSKRAPQA